MLRIKSLVFETALAVSLAPSVVSVAHVAVLVANGFEETLAEHGIALHTDSAAW